MDNEAQPSSNIMFSGYFQVVNLGSEKVFVSKMRLGEDGKGANYSTETKTVSNHWK